MSTVPSFPDRAGSKVHILRLLVRSALSDGWQSPDDIIEAIKMERPGEDPPSKDAVEYALHTLEDQGIAVSEKGTAFSKTSTNANGKPRKVKGWKKRNVSG